VIAEDRIAAERRLERHERRHDLRPVGPDAEQPIGVGIVAEEEDQSGSSAFATSMMRRTRAIGIDGIPAWRSAQDDEPEAKARRPAGRRQGIALERAGEAPARPRKRSRRAEAAEAGGGREEGPPAQGAHAAPVSRRIRRRAGSPGFALGALAPLELAADGDRRGDGRDGDRLEGAGTGLVGVLERGIAACARAWAFWTMGFLLLLP
jgi:hypothetical protein